jgi:hypothetical protein
MVLAARMSVVIRRFVIRSSGVKGYRLSAISYQLSAISYQLSAIRGKDGRRCASALIQFEAFRVREEPPDQSPAEGRAVQSTDS